MNNPQITLTDTNLETESVIIERHEDGSECRKCKNCACVNNKLANVGTSLGNKNPTEKLVPDSESNEDI